MKERNSRLGRFGRVFGRKKAAVLSVANPLPAHSVGDLGNSVTLSRSANAAAMSENMKNASVELNNFLVEVDKADLDNSSSSIIKMSRWLEKQQSYSNCGFQARSLRDFTLTPQQWLLVDLAATSAYALSSGKPTFKPKGFDIINQEEIKAGSFGSSVKEAAINSCKPAENTQGLTNTIVVGIKGSSSVHDWMVNFNPGSDTAADGDPRVGDDFLGKNRQGMPFKAHVGLLAATKQMLPKIAKQISHVADLLLKSQTSSPPPDLVLAGHSAGGAVAIMLFAHVMRAEGQSPSDTLTQLKQKVRTIHCITFGAPPITTVPIPSALADEASLFLSFINEGDPIPRADSPYINSLLRLNVSKMPLEPTMWNLPPRAFYNGGRAILIPKQGRRFAGLKLPNEEGEGSLKDTIMGDPKAHRMAYYFNELHA